MNDNVQHQEQSWKMEIADLKKDIRSTFRHEELWKFRRPSDLKTWEDLLTPKQWRDYYWTLDPRLQKMYDILLQAIIDCKETVKITHILIDKNMVGYVFHYILWDNPAIFSLGEYAIFDAVMNSNTVCIPYLSGGMDNERRQRQQVLHAVCEVLSHRGLYDMKEVFREKYVHDYIIDHYTYDDSLGQNGSILGPYTIYGLFVQKNAVCEGISKGTKLLLDCLGIHTIVVSGKGKEEQRGHAWNQVMINGVPYHLDVTFDLGNKRNNKLGGKLEYFNVTDLKVAQTRSWEPHQVLWKCTEKFTFRG